MSRKRDAEILAGMMLPAIPLAARGKDSKKPLPQKEGWPDWPFFWIDDRSMDHLREIASRLKDKMESNRPTGIIGELTLLERQFYEIISGMQQQIGELHSAFQASLQIIDDNRPSQRLRHVLKRTTEAWHEVILRLRNSTALTILGAVGAVALVVSILKYVMYYFQR